MEKENRRKAFSMTGGIGSMLIGSKKVGFDIVGNCEWRTYYPIKTFEEYFKAPMVRNLEDFPGGIPTDIDLVMSHPECGNYSTLKCVGPERKAKSKKDPGDIPLFLESMNKIKPKFFVMDNLAGSLQAVGSREYKEALPGYDIFFEWISNYHYGNTQRNRKRMFVIGAKKELEFVFVPGEEENEKKVKDVIGDLPLQEDIPEIDHVHVDPDSNSPIVDESGKKLTYKDLSEKFLSMDNHGQKIRYMNSKGKINYKPGYHRSYWDGFSYLLNGSENVFHPITGYPLTIRERARIQGAPDEMIFYGNYTQQLKQTGKFMPSEACEYVSMQIISFLDEKEFQSSRMRMESPNHFVDDAKTEYCKGFGYSNWNKACDNCWLRSGCSVRDYDLLSV